jgi:apolipoprotein N-acyltransferase
VIAMLLAAAVTSAKTADRLQKIPAEFWWKIGLGVLALVALVIVLRKVAKMNKVVLAVVVGVVLSIIGFNWVYERNEPAWATPVISRVAEFLPSKGK